jgi:hypothetical protein
MSGSEPLLAIDGTPSGTLTRNIRTPQRAKDSRLDSNDSITIFFFTDSVWGLQVARLKLVPRVAGLWRLREASGCLPGD